MRVTKSGLAMQTVAETLWRGPLGYGVLWIVVLLAEFGVAVLALSRRGFKPASYLVGALALSGLFYLVFFAVFGVADVLRYLHPVIFLAILGGPLAVAVWLSLYKLGVDVK